MYKELASKYSRVTYAEVKAAAGVVSIDYWFFYVFNTYTHNLVNHQGDWEPHQVRTPPAASAGGAGAALHGGGQGGVQEGAVEAGEDVAAHHPFAADALEEHVVQAAQQDEADDPAENRHEREADRDQPGEHARADQLEQVVALQRPPA